MPLDARCRNQPPNSNGHHLTCDIDISNQIYIYISLILGCLILAIYLSIVILYMYNKSIFIYLPLYLYIYIYTIHICHIYICLYILNINFSRAPWIVQSIYSLMKFSLRPARWSGRDDSPSDMWVSRCLR